MASSKPTDEILAALPDLGFLVWRMDNGWADQQAGTVRWHVVLEDTNADPLELHSAAGDTPAAALIEALRKAGVKVSDDPA